MQTPVLSGYRWKTKDLERLPEEPFLSYEIIDGELIVSRKPHLRHAAIRGAVPIKSGGLRGAALPQRPPPLPT
jgi:hypothetical protein